MVMCPTSRSLNPKIFTPTKKPRRTNFTVRFFVVYSFFDGFSVCILSIITPETAFATCFNPISVKILFNWMTQVLNFLGMNFLAEYSILGNSLQKEEFSMMQIPSALYIIRPFSAPFSRNTPFPA